MYMYVYMYVYIYIYNICIYIYIYINKHAHTHTFLPQGIALGEACVPDRGKGLRPVVLRSDSRGSPCRRHAMIAINSCFINS